MRSFCIVVILATLAVAYAGETYTTENDDLDIDAVVADVKTLQAWVDCFNDKGECDPVMQAFKKDMPEAILQACAKCTEDQKRIFRIFIENLKNKLFKDYEVYKNKYDPGNTRFPALIAAVASP